MIDKKAARQIVYNYVNAKIDEGDIECVILDDDTLEEADSWIFYIQSRRFVETGDIGAFLVPNGPYIVNKADGLVRTRSWWEDLGPRIDDDLFSFLSYPYNDNDS